MILRFPPVLIFSKFSISSESPKEALYVLKEINWGRGAGCTFPSLGVFLKREK